MSERMVRDTAYLYPCDIGYEESLQLTAERVQELIDKYGPDATWMVNTHECELSIFYSRPETAVERQQRERIEQQEHERKKQQKKVREAERMSLSARCGNCRHSRYGHHKKYGCMECSCIKFIEPENV